MQFLDTTSFPCAVSSEKKIEEKIKKVVSDVVGEPKCKKPDEETEAIRNFFNY